MDRQKGREKPYKKTDKITNYKIFTIMAKNLKIAEILKNSVETAQIEINGKTKFASLCTRDMNRYLRENKDSENYDFLDEIFNAKCDGNLTAVYGVKDNGGNILVSWNYVGFDGTMKNLKVTDERGIVEISGRVKFTDCKDYEKLQEFIKDLILKIDRENI